MDFTVEKREAVKMIGFERVFSYDTSYQEIHRLVSCLLDMHLQYNNEIDFHLLRLQHRFQILPPYILQLSV